MNEAVADLSYIIDFDFILLVVSMLELEPAEPKKKSSKSCCCFSKIILWEAGWGLYGLVNAPCSSITEWFWEFSLLDLALLKFESPSISFWLLCITSSMTWISSKCDLLPALDDFLAWSLIYSGLRLRLEGTFFLSLVTWSDWNLWIMFIF